MEISELSEKGGGGRGELKTEDRGLGTVGVMI